MNTEKMIIRQKSDGTFCNKVLNFEGTYNDAVKFAALHNFGGGVEYVPYELTPEGKKVEDEFWLSYFKSHPELNP